MSESQILSLRRLPLIEMNPYNMLLPNVGSISNFKRYPQLLVEARKRELPLVIVVMPRKGIKEFPARLHDVGVVASVESVSDIEPTIALMGRYRTRINSVNKPLPGKNYWTVNTTGAIEDAPDGAFIERGGEIILNPEKEEKLQGFLFNIRRKLYILIEECKGYVDMEGELLENIYDAWGNLRLDDRDSLSGLVWHIIFAVPHVDSAMKQHLIETTSLFRRIAGCMALLEVNIARIQDSKKLETSKRKLGKGRKVTVTDKDKPKPDNSEEFSTDNPEISSRWERYQKIKDALIDDAKKAIMEDLEHLKNSQPGQAEWNTFINHVDCLLDIYSAVTTPQEANFSETKSILEQSHSSLEGPKQRIYDYLAVKKLNPKGKAPIMCFVGPPGVGKTSIGRSIADSLKLKFIRLSLGGVRDEADIRGHRLTYIGAIPGKIIQEIRRSGVKNPVFLLDEVDKLTRNSQGDPSSALLEVLDPEQNHSFQDHYVSAPFDLSNVLFICTANLESGIQPALYDRMDIINISGYTEPEKIEIARKYLIPKQLGETGLAGNGIEVVWPDNNPDKVISSIISGYTREAGVRDLERQIHKIFSRWGRQNLEKPDLEQTKVLILNPELIEKLLKSPPYLSERAELTEVGESIGLVWTQVGGDIIYIQAQLTPFISGDKTVSQTGGLQEVFMQMNKNALTVAKNLLRDDEKAMDKLRTNILHLSTPDGAIPKDGPSAGVAMTIAIYSELKGIRVKPFIAFTGEITVKGRIRAVGGIKSKVLAAHRDGIKEIVLPKKNKRDVDEKISEDIKKDLIFHFVTHIKEVLPIVFTEEMPA